MFCKWCGKKIANNGRPCPSCGKNQDPLENGNGFWDLCGKAPAEQPVCTGTPEPAPEKEQAAEKPVEQKKAQPSDPKKTAKKFPAFAWAMTTVLAVILLAVMWITVGKIDLCLSELSGLRATIQSTNTLISDGFAQLDEYSHSEQDVPEIPVPEETEPATEENANADEETLPEETTVWEEAEIDLDALLRENVHLVDESRLRIMTEEVGAWHTHYHVHMAVGSWLTHDEVKVFWQKSVDEGDTWEIIAEDTFAIIVEPDERAVYRFICLLIGDYEDSPIYCAVTG